MIKKLFWSKITADSCRECGQVDMSITLHSVQFIDINSLVSYYNSLKLRNYQSLLVVFETLVVSKILSPRYLLPVDNSTKMIAVGI